MKLKPARLAPALIAACVIVLVSLVHLARWDFVERFERTTFDVRVRHAAHFSPPVSTNLGFVYIDDASIEFVRNNTVLGYNYGLYWPRQVYGRLVRELAAQRTRAMAFDVIFGELRPDHPQVQMSNGRLMESDHFFALQMHQAGNVILADGKDLSPPELFATNALALADISTDSSKDSDGVLRRAQAFHVRKKWHPLFKQVAEDPGFGVDLNRARVQSNSVVLVRSQGEPIVIPLDPEGRFELADFVGDTIPAGMQPKARPYEEERI